MKPIRIDFIPSRQWVWIWGVAGVVVLGLSGHFAWKAAGVLREQRAMEMGIADLQRKLAEARGQAEPKADPRQKSRDAALALLRVDYNKVFSTIENVQEPGTRLRSVRVDAASNTVQLEYDLQSVQHASRITSALNAGFDTRPWVLKEVAISQGGARAGTIEGLGYRGAWAGRLDHL